MLPCNLIFEGQGRVGKTTTIAALKEYLAYRGIITRNYKMPVPKTAAEGHRQYDFYANNLVANRSDILIYDRGHLSEMVYGPTWRGQNTGGYYNDAYHQFLHDIDRDIIEFCNVPTYVIYLYPQWARITGVGTRATDDLIAVPRLYEEVLYHTRLNVIRVSTHKDTVPEWRLHHEVVSDIVRKVL